MASVTNTEVFGLETSIFRSGYPMLSEVPSGEDFNKARYDIKAAMINYDLENDEKFLYDNPHIKRAIKLANAQGGGHDQFLTGIVVNFDMTFSNKAWVEAERYTFLNFISSQSTMHRASSFSISDCCNDRVNPAIVAELKWLQERYNEIEDPDAKKKAYLDLLYNLPSGFELTAGMTTNYRCLKNIYAQRRNHRLPDWHVVCDWIESLPLSGYLITGKAVK